MRSLDYFSLFGRTAVFWPLAVGFGPLAKYLSLESVANL
jgi:hypothetical protein